MRALNSTICLVKIGVKLQMWFSFVIGFNQQLWLIQRYCVTKSTVMIDITLLCHVINSYD